MNVSNEQVSKTQCHANAHLVAEWIEVRIAGGERKRSAQKVAKWSSGGSGSSGGSIVVGRVVVGGVVAVCGVVAVGGGRRMRQRPVRALRCTETM